MLPRLWGNGRLDSVDDKTLDYLSGLGVDYLWLTGVPRHASGKDFVKGNPGCPYSVSDWYDVNHYLAKEGESSMKTFDKVCKHIHDKGLKLIIDYIPNHVARDYSGKIATYSRCDGDWTDTLKVNWTDAGTEMEMLNVLRFWKSRGVDGFRCDMVELVPADSLGRIVSALKNEYPDTLFVAEVYRRENYERYVNEVGFDLLYDKSGVYDIERGILNGSRSARELTWNWQFLGERQPYMLNFLENHDEQRLASQWFAGSVERSWAALSFSLLFNTASFMLYFGQECGEDASEGDCGRTSIFNWCKPLSIGHLNAFIESGGGITPKEMATLGRYRSLLRLSHRSAFASGSVWDLCYCNLESAGFNPDRHFVFMRYDNSESWMVFCNFSDVDCTVDVKIPPELKCCCSESCHRISVAPSDAAVVRLT